MVIEIDEIACLFALRLYDKAYIIGIFRVNAETDHKKICHKQKFNWLAFLSQLDGFENHLYFY